MRNAFDEVTREVVRSKSRRSVLGLFAGVPFLISADLAAAKKKKKKCKGGCPSGYKCVKGKCRGTVCQRQCPLECRTAAIDDGCGGTCPRCGGGDADWGCLPAPGDPSGRLTCQCRPVTCPVDAECGVVQNSCGMQAICWLSEAGCPVDRPLCGPDLKCHPAPS